MFLSVQRLFQRSAGSPLLSAQRLSQEYSEKRLLDSRSRAKASRDDSLGLFGIHLIPSSDMLLVRISIHAEKGHKEPVSLYFASWLFTAHSGS